MKIIVYISYAKPKKKHRKIIPLKNKTLGNKIEAYTFVEVRWLDIEGDDGWSTLKVLRGRKATYCCI